MVQPPQAAPTDRLPRWERRLLVCLIGTSVLLLALTVAGIARARADSVACPTDNESQAFHLIDKAANEPCRAQIWQLRTSAAHHRPAAP
jgi:hypothetical protein